MLLVVDYLGLAELWSAGRSKRQAAVELSALWPFRPSTTTTRSASSCSTAESKSSFHRARGRSMRCASCARYWRGASMPTLAQRRLRLRRSGAVRGCHLDAAGALSRLRRSAGPVDDPSPHQLAGAMGFCRRIPPRRAVVFDLRLPRRAICQHCVASIAATMSLRCWSATSASRAFPHRPAHAGRCRDRCHPDLRHQLSGLPRGALPSLRQGRQRQLEAALRGPALISCASTPAARSSIPCWPSSACATGSDDEQPVKSASGVWFVRST